MQEQKGKGKQDDKQVVDTPLEEGLAGRRKSLGRTQASENQTASKHGANGSMWKGKVVFPCRLLIRTRRDFPFVLELNKLQRIGIFGGKNNISGETRPGSRQIASTSLAGSHSGLIPKQQSLKTPLKR